jgi:ketosteroid isomerase-like protein
MSTLWGIAGGCDGPSPAGAIAMTVESVLNAYEKALNANDIETILRLFGAEPVFMPEHAPALVGRDAVRAGYESVFATIKLDVRFTIHDSEGTDGWAWARTSSAGRTRILASGAEIQEGNNELFIFRKEGGEWKIHRYLFATNQPAAA